MEDPISYLLALRRHHSQADIARALQTTARTVRRWEARETDPPPYLLDALRQRMLLPQESQRPAPGQAAFRFIDLFAGIGGLRTAFQAQGGQCVFTSEYDSYAQKTYLANFPDAIEHMAGDITKVKAKDIPDHDVLLAGFPCQPFSIAGVSKKNALGRAHGFADETQGTLFFDVQRIIAEKRPAAFLLENVKNLVSHDKGNTFRVIRGVLEQELGYHIHCKVLDGGHWVPQHRERILIVGFRESTDFDWQDVRIPATRRVLGDILHPQDGSEMPESHYTTGAKAKVDARYTLTPKLWAYLQAYAAKHKAAGNGFGYGLVNAQSVTRTLSARYYKDGSEILLSQGVRQRPRRLTPRECARLMGFADEFVIPVSDTRAYQLIAKSTVVPMVSSVAKCMVERLPKKPSMPVFDLRDGAFPSQGNWTEEQTKLAFHFYCQTPFGQLHGRNPKVIALAKLIGRTPSALAMKCCNIASIDPAMQARGVVGLGNASSLDRHIWTEFHADWDRLAIECEALLGALRARHAQPVADQELVDAVEDAAQDFSGETRKAIVELRVKQHFFRRAVLSGYRNRCCITGISDSRLLVASHIVPWRDDASIRLHPGNGLCLSALHDKAFDHYLFSLTDEYRIVLSPALEKSKDECLREIFHPIAGRQIELPERFVPETNFVQRHRERMMAAP
ncbi:MAG TPA: DNA (cytosine-5-)-methyltransferase [Thermomonas sp.]|uniref:DNA (cytosine-5-)-methyltransferase n=1 Tax=Thermomonas sp. TaxID=1971895 RepID=UPI002C362294|nr:DNA (cytosine-5-)-methyltransferase [Thermomonas sp.]HOV97128.1 DNA (cytosine-5-)-methyltransferase [Thermomonas sp.]